MQRIWVNTVEKTGKFLGAYSSLELALDASVSKVDKVEAVVTMEYQVINGKINQKELTVEDILNGEN